MKYKLFYAGYDLKNDIEQIGVAFSDDFKSWIFPKENPIIPLSFSGQGDVKQTSNPCVLKVGDKYKMWYQGKSKENKLGIFYAESDDCIKWKAHNEAVLEYNLNNDDFGYRTGFQHPHVIVTPERKYIMWYSLTIKNISKIGVASSDDGINWNILNNEVLCPEYEWEGAHLYYPMVIYENSIYKLWYTYKSKLNKWGIGYTESVDGINWSRKRNLKIIPIILPKSIRVLFEFFLKIFDFELKLPIHGIASVNIWKEEGQYKLLAHEVGSHGRLYIAQYLSDDGINWVKNNNDIFEKMKMGDWSRFFQGDPYLYVE